MGFKYVHMETDSLVIYNLLSRKETEDSNLQVLVHDCARLTKEFQQVWASFCYRDSGGARKN